MKGKPGFKVCSFECNLHRLQRGSVRPNKQHKYTFEEDDDVTRAAGLQGGAVHVDSPSPIAERRLVSNLAPIG
jgi:hypothetical protein